MVQTANHLIQRREQWNRLEDLLDQMGNRQIKKLGGQGLVELSDLYRSACTDLAMAEQYRLSPETVSYLHGLVGRTHNAIYRSRHFQYGEWFDVLFRQAPQQIFQDPCVHLCSILFFGLFALSAFLSFNEEAFPGLAERIVGPDQIEMMETMYEEADFSKGASGNLPMVGFYIWNNTGIGMRCFATGPAIIPGIWTTAFNATFLGAAFGYMARPSVSAGDSFLNFVTAHGPFELTAIALAAAAGLRIGFGWLFPGTLRRWVSMFVNARRAVPIIAASGVLFVLAAFTEGLISPTGLPYLFKAIYGMLCSVLLMFYFIVLGYPSEN